MKINIYILSLIAIVCIFIYFLNYYLPNFERSLSDGNVIINSSINDSQLTKSFICSYKSDNPLFNEIWLEKKMWRKRNFRNSHIYSLRFTTQSNIEQIELLSIDGNSSGFGKANSVFFVETDDKNILVKEKILCKFKINGIIQNINFKRTGNASNW